MTTDEAIKVLRARGRRQDHEIADHLAIQRSRCEADAALARAASAALAERDAEILRYKNALLTIANDHIGHVLVGDSNVVLDPTFAGNRFHSLWAFLWSDRPILWCVEVPVTSHPDWSRHESATRLKPPPTLPTILRWATRGLFPARNCVTEVVERLRACGIAVPPRMVSPQQLYDWLRSEGHHIHDFARCTSQRAHSRGVGTRGLLSPCACPECIESRGRTGPAPDDV